MAFDLNKAKERTAALAKAAAGGFDRSRDSIVEREMRKTGRPVRRSSVYGGDHDGGGNVGVMDAVMMEKAVDPWQKEAHAINDNLFLLGAILERDPRDTDYYRFKMEKSDALRKAMDTAEVGGGAEWIPTQFSQSFIEAVDLEAKVAPLFDTLPMATNPFVVPFESSLMDVFLVPEQTSDEGASGKVTESAAGTGKLTLTAKKIGVRSIISDELDEDSVVPMLPFIRKAIARAMAKGRDSAMVNGDNSGSHFDADVTTTTNVQNAFRGLRYHALNITGGTWNNSTFDETYIRKLRGLMDIYGVDPSELAWISGPKVYLKKIVNLTSYTTREKFGDQAVVVTGEVAKLEGIPLIVSSVMKETLAADGTWDATSGHYGSLLLVYRPAWKIGLRREMDLRMWEDPRYQQKSLVSTARWAFGTHLTSAPVCVAGIAIETVS